MRVVSKLCVVRERERERLVRAKKAAKSEKWLNPAPLVQFNASVKVDDSNKARTGDNEERKDDCQSQEEHFDRTTREG